MEHNQEHFIIYQSAVICPEGRTQKEFRKHLTLGKFVVSNQVLKQKDGAEDPNIKKKKKFTKS